MGKKDRKAKANNQANNIKKAPQVVEQVKQDVPAARVEALDVNALPMGPIVRSLPNVQPTQTVVITEKAEKKKGYTDQELLSVQGSIGEGIVTEVTPKYVKIKTKNPINGLDITVLGYNQTAKFGKQVQFEFGLYMRKFTAENIKEVGNSTLSQLNGMPVLDVIYSSDFDGNMKAIGRSKDGKYVILQNGDNNSSVNSSFETVPNIRW
jgi:hypothetical protein